jgi:serine/threonine-protein kinase
MRYAKGDRLDGFEIVEELGAGAYAETYKARVADTGEFVVLKVPNPSLLADPAIFQRFRRERSIAERLDHPNVVGYRDDESSRSDQYIVLEYIDGESLRSRMNALRAESPDGALPVGLALEWGRQLADAIGYMHRQGVIHRDLKPENVLVSAHGQLKIIDFGTALLEGARRLTFKHLTEGLGTPDYMSPEQIQGDRGDARSDLYAWGVIMYELLTGQVPFGGDNWMAVMAGHLTKTPERIRRDHPDVSPALEAVVLTAMRRLPEHRYADADHLLRDLHHLDELDVTTFDLSPEPALGGMAAVESTRRLWAVIGLVAVGFLALCILIVVISVIASN